MKQFVALLGLLNLTALGCLADQQESWKTNTLAPGLTIQLPTGVKITRQTPTGDFELFVFRKESKTILSAYLGNQPEFPKEKTHSSIKRETIKGLSAESTSRQEPDGTLSREVLVHLRADGTLPQKLHFWYVHSRAVDAPEADKMIASVHLSDAIYGKEPQH